MLLEHVEHGERLDLDVARVVVVHDLGARLALLLAHHLEALEERHVLGLGDALHRLVRVRARARARVRVRARV